MIPLAKLGLPKNKHHEKLQELISKLELLVQRLDKLPDLPCMQCEQHTEKIKK